VRRDPAALEFVDLEKELPVKILLDTTVYIDAFQGRLPRDVDVVLRTAHIFHSTVTEAELAATIGHLDPADRRTAPIVKTISASIDRRPLHRIRTPDRDTWREAAIASGIIARLQRYAKTDRRRALNDALIYFTALKHGDTVLTRNLGDFDFLQQLMPGGRLLFYA
jgi:predicted nucleic acid-binding protein